jgi:hypothetical protein
MNKRLILLVIIIFLIGNGIFSQKIFRDGYVITKDGVSMNGLVEYSPNQDIPAVCSFRRFDIARVVNYGPQEIIAFGYKNGNRYESVVYNNKAVFLEVIVSGRIRLLSKSGNYFLDKDHLGLVELRKGPVTYPPAGNKKEYKTLEEFLADITERKEINKSEQFELKDDLIPLIALYNKESGMPFNVYNRTVDKKSYYQKASVSGTDKNRFGIMSGVNIYKYNFTTGSYIDIINPSEERDLTYGITFERILSVKNDRSSLRIDLLYCRQSLYSYYEGYSSSGTFFVRNDVFINFSGIKLPIMMQYSFSGRRIVPYLNAGLAYQHLLTSGYQRIKEDESVVEGVESVVYTYEDHDMIFKSGEISFFGGIGVRAKLFGNLNVHLEGKVESGNGILEMRGTGERDFEDNSLQGTVLFGITF